MRLAINTFDGGALRVEDFDAVSLMQMLDHWDDGPTLLTIALDTGTAYIPKTSVARIDATYPE